MKNRILSYTAILLALLFIPLFTACEGVDEVGTGAEETGGDVVLTISVPQYSAEWDEGTRALEQLPDNLQKQIHNLWYYFYNEEQMLTYVFHQNIKATTTHSVNFKDFTEAAEARGVTFSISEGYIYIVANSENMDNNLTDEQQKPFIVLNQNDRPTGDYEAWRSSIANVDGFKQNALMPLYISGRADPNTPQSDNPAVGKPGHLMLFGSFHGKFHSEAEHTMSVVLGRSVARLRVALSGEGLGPQARITIQNAPIVTTLFPDAQPLYTDGDSRLDCWTDYMEMVSTDTDKGITGTSGNYSVSTYYYCGENSTHDYPIVNPGNFGDQDESGRFIGKVSTTLIVETWNTKNEGNSVTSGEGTANPVKTDATTPDRTYKVVLGYDIPSGSSSSSSTAGTARDLNLYRNTSYTFNINLMTGTPPSTQKNTRPAQQHRTRREASPFIRFNAIGPLFPHKGSVVDAIPYNHFVKNGLSLCED